MTYAFLTSYAVSKRLGNQAAGRERLIESSQCLDALLRMLGCDGESLPGHVTAENMFVAVPGPDLEIAGLSDQE